MVGTTKDYSTGRHEEQHEEKAPFNQPSVVVFLVFYSPAIFAWNHTGGEYT